MNLSSRVQIFGETGCILFNGYTFEKNHESICPLSYVKIVGQNGLSIHCAVTGQWEEKLWIQTTYNLPKKIDLVSYPAHGVEVG